MESRLHIDNVSIYDGTSGRRVILEHVSLEMRPGQILGLHGPNASGKSSLIRTVAGFIPIMPTGRSFRSAWGDERRWATGRIALDGRDVSQLNPGERNMAMVPQNLALYPDKTVIGNLEFPLLSRGVEKRRARDLAMAMAEHLDLSRVAERRPGRISGGQQQRVAIGRALIANPTLVLLDEPLANLDALGKHEILTLIGTVMREKSTSAIYVTHDPEEASMLCDVVAFVQDGRLHQVSTPREAYRNPATLFVARMFAGFSNVISGTLTDGVFVPSACTAGWRLGQTRTGSRSGQRVHLAARPSAIRIESSDTMAPNGTVVSTYTVGDALYARVRMAANLTIAAFCPNTPQIGDTVNVRLCDDPSDVRLFPSEDGPAAALEPPATISAGAHGERIRSGSASSS